MQKVLVIEDSLEIREMYALKLKKGGYNTFIAETGEEGLEIIKKEKPDIILLDIMLPKMDGYDVLTEMKKMPEDIRDIHVVIISNLSSKQDYFEAKKLGADDYLVKAENTPADVLKKVDDFFATK